MNQALYAHMNNKRKMKKKHHLVDYNKTRHFIGSLIKIFIIQKKKHMYLYKVNHLS
jgi:hypothetical protein